MKTCNKNPKTKKNKKKTFNKRIKFIHTKQEKRKLMNELRLNVGKFLSCKLLATIFWHCCSFTYKIRS